MNISLKNILRECLLWLVFRASVMVLVVTLLHEHTVCFAPSNGGWQSDELQSIRLNHIRRPNFQESPRVCNKPWALMYELVLYAFYEYITSLSFKY